MQDLAPDCKAWGLTVRDLTISYKARADQNRESETDFYHGVSKGWIAIAIVIILGVLSGCWKSVAGFLFLLALGFVGSVHARYLFLKLVRILPNIPIKLETVNVQFEDGFRATKLCIKSILIKKLEKVPENVEAIVQVNV